MGSEGKSVNHLVARSAVPHHVSTAVASTRRVTDEHLAAAQPVSIRAVGWRLGDPPPVAGHAEIANHGPNLVAATDGDAVDETELDVSVY